MPCTAITGGRIVPGGSEAAFIIMQTEGNSFVDVLVQPMPMFPAASTAREGWV